MAEGEMDDEVLMGEPIIISEKEARVVAAAETLVEYVMGTYDSSHDCFHAYRVRNVALALAAEEGIPHESLFTIQLAALLHDIDDHKYAAKRPKHLPTAEEFLEKSGVEEHKIQAVLKIIHGMGFKEELARGGSDKPVYSPEFAVVQDADRLDAMGAIGIARTFTYGGSKNNVMHDPTSLPRFALTKEGYMKHDRKHTTINHFHEKLLKLKDLMKTEAGRKRAEARHRVMVDFLAEFDREWREM